MVVGRARAALPSVACMNCQLALLNASTPSASFSIHLSTRPFFLRSTTYHQSTSRLPLSTSRSWSSSLVQQRTLFENEAIEDDDVVVEAELTSKQDDTSALAKPPPWYLQVDTPERTSNPLLQRQRIPELPADPPPLLQPILEHISIDLGLDDLMLYDLRNINPPPALGANLLMVLGTARSEKHLHMSADRLCKWLKTTHKLSPYPDGLLGRGELKLKLRRKARRARLLSNVGSSETSNADDGLRTGWICVDVGTIDDGKGPPKRCIEQKDYVGFGERVGGAKVVIQMLTAEKREELDLEDLWGKMQRRQERKEERISKGQEVLPIIEEVGPMPIDLERSHSDLLSSSSSSYKLRTGKFNQRRHYHHQSVLPEAGLKAPLNNEHGGPDDLRYKYNTTPSRNFCRGSRMCSTSSGFQSHQRRRSKQYFDDTSRLIVLQALVDHSYRLPAQDAIRALGEGADDFDSTTFLSSFYQAYPLFPSADHWECRLALVCHGVIVGHPGYSKIHLDLLIKEMQSTLFNIPARLYLRLFKTYLSSSREHLGRHCLSTKSLRAAISILEFMSLQGQNILTEEIRSDLLVATVRASTYSDECHHRKPSARAFQNLKFVLDKYLDTPPTVETELRMLHEHADQQNWAGFEEHWRGFARDMRPRPKALYLAMFRRAAQRRHQAFVMRILRERVPEMSREEPAVELDADLAEVVTECLLVAEPSVERMAMQQCNHEREWVKLWRRCQQSLQEETLPLS